MFSQIEKYSPLFEAYLRAEDKPVFLNNLKDAN